MWGKTQSVMLPEAAGGRDSPRDFSEKGDLSASVGGALSAGATVGAVQQDELVL